MEMAAIIEDSKNAYQARDKSLNEMASLQQVLTHSLAYLLTRLLTYSLTYLLI
jgi:hypothetical protein